MTLSAIAHQLGPRPSLLLLGTASPATIASVLDSLAPALVLDPGTPETRPVRDWCRARGVHVAIVQAVEALGEAREARRDAELVSMAARLGRGVVALPGAPAGLAEAARAAGLMVWEVENSG